MLKAYPLRDPHPNRISTTIYFNSIKKERQVFCESNLEWDFAILLDHDPSVIDYCEQGIELEWSKSKWTPDFVALIKNNDQYQILIFEVKYLKELLEKKIHFEQKFRETEEWIQIHQSELAQKLTNLKVQGIEFLIITDQILNQSFRTYNLRKLIESRLRDDLYKKIKFNILKILDLTSEIQIGDIANILYKRLSADNISIDNIWSCIYKMMFSFELNVDYEKLITNTSIISKPTYSHSLYEPIYSWSKHFKWNNQQADINKIIPHIDLFGTGTTQEKSIRYWDIANERLNLIRSLMDRPLSEIQNGSYNFLGKSISWQTVYHWISIYRKSNGDLKVLLPNYHLRGRKKSNSTNAIKIWEFGKSQYLEKEDRSIRAAYSQTYAFSKLNGIDNDLMSFSTFYRNISIINKKDITLSKKGINKAEKDFKLTESEFQHGNFPLQTVQIDHTPIDVLVVDEEHRLVTERPFLSVALDTYSRCVLGYYITYNEPSRLSIAMVLLNCVSNKKTSITSIRTQFPNLSQDQLLAIESSGWAEVYGLPYTLHMDNGSDFASDDIQLFGKAYQVHLHYRAVNKPQHGAYIERFLGTINRRLHAIPGTTFSNVKERDEYPSEKRAQYTIKELEARILLEFIQYHEEYHSELMMSPLAKWNEGFSLDNQERGLNRNIDQLNFNHFKLDVLPSELRTVQKSGVEIFDLHYSSDKIMHLVGSRDQKDRMKARKFRIRYDPRDLRSIFFYNEDKHEYLELECVDGCIKKFFKCEPISLWEWKSIKYNRITRGNQKELRERRVEFVHTQKIMDETTAIRSKASRQRISRKLKQKYDLKLVYNNSLVKESEIEPSQGISVFAVRKPKEIVIPPRSENPFSGMTKAKAQELADQNNRGDSK